jgi:hypothetical protein
MSDTAGGSERGKSRGEESERKYDGNRVYIILR